MKLFAFVLLCAVAVVLVAMVAGEVIEGMGGRGNRP